MLYEYFCTSPLCSASQEEQHPVDGFKEYRPKCLKCGCECEYQFVPTVVQVALIDGPSGSWPSKGERFKKYRAKTSEEAGKRQRDRYGEMKGAIPNYNGTEVPTWNDAKELALKDKGVESAATFDFKIKEEKVKT